MILASVLVQIESLDRFTVFRYPKPTSGGAKAPPWGRSALANLSIGLER
jgi:hypothetical protein